MKTVTEGKVASILSESQIAINVGSNAGVRLDDSVRVLRQVEIRDPDTNELLGSILLHVVGLKVNFVIERTATAIVVEHLVSNSASISSSIFGGNPLITLTTKLSEVDSQTVHIAKGQRVVIERQEQ
jgi:hypothetical protein